MARTSTANTSRNNSTVSRSSDSESVKAEALIIIEDVINQVRMIVKQFEGLLHEFRELMQIIADVWYEVRSLFSPSQRAHFEPTESQWQQAM